MALTPEVEQAIEELRRSFAGHEIESLEDGTGGAHLKVLELKLGKIYRPSTSWVAFHIGFQYPQADVYPHYVRADLASTDGATLPAGFHLGQRLPGFDEPATMVSRRSNRRDPTRDTAALKLLRVLEWIRAAG